MNRGLLMSILTLMWSTQAGAVVCKTVDEDGRIGYTDVPVEECQNPVKLPDYSRYSPRPIATQTSPVAATESEPFTGYNDMTIVMPEANGTVRSNEGRVPVAIELQPALQADHRVSLLLDARPVEGEFSGTNIELNGVDRGTHTLRAQVRDASGAVLISSSSVLFTLRKRGLLDGPREPENPVEPEPPQPGFPAEPNPNPGYPSPDNPNPGFGAPDVPPDYRPGTPNYTPPSGGIPTTPGQTNPAFAPKYNP